MSTAFYALCAFSVILVGGLIGLSISKALPEKYCGDDVKKVVQVTTGMISLVTALVLGLMVATAKNKFDLRNKQTEEFAANLMRFNRELVNCGPEADDIRLLLRKYVVAKIAETWAQEPGPRGAADDPPAWRLLETVQQKIRGLSPQSEIQRSAATVAAQISIDLTKTTWLETAQESDHVPQPFIWALIVWLFLLFISFGLFAPRNALVIAALLVGAVSIAGAVALVVDMDAPFEGVIVVSADPMKNALATIGAP